MGIVSVIFALRLLINDQKVMQLIFLLFLIPPVVVAICGTNALLQPIRLTQNRMVK